MQPIYVVFQIQHGPASDTDDGPWRVLYHGARGEGYRAIANAFKAEPGSWAIATEHNGAPGYWTRAGAALFEPGALHVITLETVKTLESARRALAEYHETHEPRLPLPARKGSALRHQQERVTERIKNRLGM